jgi:DNA polymerase-4
MDEFIAAVVEVWGWDEAFMPIEADDPETFARDVQARILAHLPRAELGTGPSRSRIPRA